MPLLDVMVPEDIGETEEECVVVTWLKKEGDLVKKGETLLILQVAKVSYDVPAPATGKLVTILARQGEVVKHGQPLARLDVEAREAAPPSAPAERAAVTSASQPSIHEVKASPLAKRLAREHKVDLTQVRGSGSGGRITEKDVLAFIAAQKAKEKAAAGSPPRSVQASPIARRLADEHNVDLSQVRGTGRGGRITQKDVLAFIDTQQPLQVLPGEEGPATKPQVTPATEGTVPLTGMRATIARRMRESLQNMAQLTLHTEADVTELVALREHLKKDVPLTYTDLIVRACALALREHPRLNATLKGQVIHLLPNVNIGIAVALDDGLIVPVIPDADQKDLTELALARQQLVERARTGRLTETEVSGGTFTVTNLGTYDVDAFTPIINPPEAAILGVGRIVEKVVIHQGKVAQRAMMTLSLTFDHRLVDGAPAAAFLQSVKRLLEAPHALL